MEDKRTYSYAAIIAAVFSVVALVVAGVSVVIEDWWTMGFAGITVLAGICWAMLSWRDE